MFRNAAWLIWARRACACAVMFSAWMEVLESASSHEDALGKQLRDRRKTGVGRRRQSVVAEMNEGTPPPSARLTELAALDEDDDES